jgi:molybdopterin-guanine dinucleotide biosynthesis protein A
MQPVFALVHRMLAQSLQDYLVGGGRVGEWMRRQNAALAIFRHSGRVREYQHAAGTAGRRGSRVAVGIRCA